jgi:predicted hotdog family 3-hydroxylacyl-ACP dehydratase
MCLIQELVEWDQERIVCRSRSHLSEDNPLRSGNQLSAIHTIEYGAQAIGLHGRLIAGPDETGLRSGLLVGLRQVKLHRSRLDDTDQPLIITAQQLLADAQNLVYAFAVHLNRTPLAEGRAAIITQQGEIN